MKKVYLFDCLKIVFKVDLISALVVFILKFISALVPALQTLLVAKFVDNVTNRQIRSVFESEIMLPILSLIVLIAYSWITKSLINLLEQHIEMRVREKYKTQLIEKISRLKYEYMENGSTRDKIARVSKDFEVRIRSAYINMLNFLELVVKVAGILLIMFTQVWWVAVLIFFVSVPCFYIAVKSGKKEYDAEIEVTKINRMNEYYNEMLKSRDYVEERTLFQYNDAYISRFSKQYEYARRYKTKVRLKWFIKMKAGSMATIVVSAVLIAVLVPLTLQKMLSLGMFMALINAVFNIVQNMSWDLTWAINRNMWFHEYFKDLRDINHLEEDNLFSESKTRIREFKELEFRNVSFKYPGTEQYILKDLSFRIEAGKKYALVGANGAGKTTIIKLMNGLYQDYEGEILLNGKEIRQYDRRFMATVFQDFARYPLSLKENISIIRQGNTSEEEIRHVIKDAGLDQTVSRLNNGMHSCLGKYKKDSQDVSGGEWQKIALARCILSKAPFKILDEPTSAMDPVFETMIYDKFKQISQNKTILLITHRLASVKMSDIILVLQDGKLVEQGTHQQLLNNGGLYKTMYTEQAKWYDESGKVEISYE